MSQLYLQDSYGLLPLFGFDKSMREFHQAAEAFDSQVVAEPFFMDAGDVLIHCAQLNPVLFKQGKAYGHDYPTGKIYHCGDSGNSLSEHILGNAKLMDKLKGHTSNTAMTLIPSVLSPVTARLARELDCGMMLRSPFPENDAQGQLLPGLGYLETHPVTDLNSKAEQYGRVQEYDSRHHTDLAPSGGVARSLQQVEKLVRKLTRKGHDVILKNDVGAGGFGVCNLNFDEDDGLPMEVRLQIFLEKNRLRVDGLHPLIVQERIEPLILQPSLEIYVPPKDGDQVVEPFIIYHSLMQVFQNKFLGLTIPDPWLISQADARVIGKGADRKVHDSVQARLEYSRVNAQLETCALEIARQYQADGYVGNMDADCGVSMDASDRMAGKVFEFNLGRDNGGTYPDRLRRKMQLGPEGAVISRDMIFWKDAEHYNVGSLLLKLSGLLFDRSRGGGVIVNNIAPRNNFFSGWIAGRDWKTADEFVTKLRDRKFEV